MTENQLDALVNDGIFNLRSALFQLERHIAHERETLAQLEADREAELSGSRLPAGVVAALRATAELRLLVQMRRQAGRFVDDEGQRSQGSSRTLGSEEDDLYDGSDY